MNRKSLPDMSAGELVAVFESIALAQDEAINADENATFNRLYDRMDKVKLELKSRPGDQRSELAPLLDHVNAQVRLKAAIALLAVAPASARKTLQEIRDRNEYPQAADARGMIRALDDGSFTPA